MILILKHNFTEKLSVVKLKFGFSTLLHLYNNLLVNLYSNVVFLPLLSLYFHCDSLQNYTMESRYNEGPRDWQNVFAMTRCRYIEVLFHTLH